MVKLDVRVDSWQGSITLRTIVNEEEPPLDKVPVTTKL